MFRNRANRLHFVGIGGIGMSGIAEVLVTLKYDVRGSDLQQSPTTVRLHGMGITVHKGHAAANVGDADVVVISSSVHADNPEVVEAKRRGIPVIKRAEMLAELMRLKYGIAVAGTHGKTTTTSLIATILDRGGFDPTMVIGGRLKSISTNARLGAGEYLVAEADESDGTFLRLIPTIAVVTNIDLEHLDHWQGGLPQIVDAFVNFVNKVPFYGAAVLCLDHPTVQTLLPRLEKRFVTYGFSPQAEFTAEDVQVKAAAMAFTVKRSARTLGRVQVRLIGRHNVLNALAAIAVAEEVGVPFSDTAQALAEFAGIGRRFEIKGTVADVMVVDDYGHHPTEIKVTLEAARAAYSRRLVVAFQPHRYSRTRDLLEDFANSFNVCNVLLITDIYAAGEAPIDGVSGEALAQVVRTHGHRDVRWIGSPQQAAAELFKIVRPGDLVLTFGAGSIYQVGEELLALLATSPVASHG
jgi:UDP-N-acetylmuramate--alanine ligase